MRLPNLSTLSLRDGKAETGCLSDHRDKRQKPAGCVELTVTETTEIHIASLSVLEMMLAEFSHGFLKLFESSAAAADLDSSSDETGALPEIVALRERLQDLSVTVVDAMERLRQLGVYQHARCQMASGFLELIERRVYNSEMNTECVDFLSRYLEEREIPPNTAPAMIRQSSDYVYEEYFDQQKIGILDGSFNKMIRVLSVPNRPYACVGVIMLNDVPKTYGDSELPEWKMQGVLSCPFYRTHRGGASSAILSHLKARVANQSLVKTILVEILRSAPDFWKYRLQNTDFINCVGCVLSDYRKQKLLVELEKRRAVRAS